MLSLSWTSLAEGLSAPKSKKDIKSFYAKIDDEAKKLEKGDDAKVVENVLSSCLMARSFEPNLFCLDSILDYYIKNTKKVQKVAKESLSKDDSEFIIKRLETLKFETEHGNDPSAY